MTDPRRHRFQNQGHRPDQERNREVMKPSVRSTSTRTFLVIPALVMVEQIIRRRPVRPRWLPTMAWGFLQYRMVGRYRNRHGGGGPGLKKPPEHLLSTGPYALTRNPMYLGHIIYLLGLTLFTRSPVASAITAAHIPWFQRRVSGDEANLEQQFGEDYRKYKHVVPLWVQMCSARHQAAQGSRVRPSRLTDHRAFRSLREGNYRMFFTGHAISVVGTWMQRVAQDWLVLSLTNSPVALGWTLTFQFLPVLAFGLWGGTIADRMDKRKLVIGTQVAQAGLALTLGTLAGAGLVQLWMVYLLAFFLGCVTVLDSPARHGLVSEMVPPTDIVNAQSLSSSVHNTGRLIGPAIAGVTTAWAGGTTSGWLTWTCLAFGAVCLASAFAPSLWMIFAFMVPLGLSNALFNNVARSILQVDAGRLLRGRVASLHAVLFLGTKPIGGPLVGWIVEKWGAWAGLAVGGVSALTAGLLALVWLHTSNEWKEGTKEVVGQQPAADQAVEIIDL